MGFWFERQYYNFSGDWPETPGWLFICVFKSTEENSFLSSFDTETYPA